MLIQPKNWAIFQHYKDRSPPWIKLHRDLLNDRQFMRLPIASKALAPMLWLLASENKDGIFDASVDELHFRLRLDEKDIKTGVKALIDNGFFVIVSEVLAECYQVAIPEREGETEKETDKEKKRSKAATPPQDVDNEVWEDWKQLRKAKRATVTDTVVNEARKEATKAGMSLNQFFKEWCLRGSQGLKAEWLTNNQSDKRTEHQKRQDASARALLGDAYFATPTMTAIEGEVIDEKSPFTRRLGR